MKRICLVLADATRARIFSYQQLLEPDGPHDELREERDLVDPERHKRASELFSDHAGTNHTHGHANDDHRQAHLDELDTRFAQHIAGEVEHVLRDEGARELVVVASARMLGRLRTSLEPLRRTVTIKELARDFTKLASTELRDRLAEHDLLPARSQLRVASR